ncbi:hypothetical protein DN388_15980 [Pseudomonas sp. S12(2018)]|uniref:hypothetical protein n=1 Tax=Pseudomonas sp. S12(2018) TaxID=2219664 RepID=UPI0020CCA70F|nr:hypothetical protein [Pseudomonas sp. S12(2018)]MCQ0168456.1 hypothetical protein [Pseudomonas sp. S12(2018)]
MDTNKMRDISREQFEAWHRSVVDGEPPHEKYSNGDYRNQHVQRYWLGWQASREAVVVELPPKISAHNTTEGGFIRPEAEHYDEAVDDCREAIEAQGLRVKP